MNTKINTLLIAAAVFFSVALIALSALADDFLNMREFRDNVCYDGDTCYVIAPTLPEPLQKMSVRILGIDTPEMRAECEEGRDMGFDGKTLIHPAQVAVTNDAFAPSAEEIELAERQIAAFEEIEAAGQGVAVVDGRIVENLHVASAREILAKAKAIDALTKE